MQQLRNNIQLITFCSVALYFFIQLLLLANQAFSYFFDIIALLFMSWIVYFMLSPVVHFFEKKKIPRLVVVLCIYFLITFLLIIIGIIAIPAIINQLQQFISNFPGLLSSFEDYVIAIAAQLKIKNITTLDDILSQYSESFLQISSGMITNWLSFLSTTLSFSFYILITLVISSMLLIDERAILNGIKALIPVDLHDELHYLNKRINKSFGGFLRGQFILALLYGIATWVTLVLFQVPFALIAGILAFILMLIPFFNGMVCFIPGIAITLLVRPEVIVWVALILFLVSMFEFNILFNLLMSDAVGVHPIIIILSILIGSKLAGIFGVIFSIPIAGVLTIIPEYWLYRQKVAQKKLTESPG